MYLFCSGFLLVVGTGSKNEPEGKKKSTESSQVLLEKEILAQQGVYFIYIRLSRATTITMLMWQFGSLASFSAF